jgi:hypothetical protein
MTEASGRDLEARIRAAENQLHAGETRWWLLYQGQGFDFNDKPLLISRLWDNLPDDQRLIAINAAWTLPDYPEQCLQREKWLKMYRDVGYIEGREWQGRRGTPPDQITLWRGGVRETGMSWTVDRRTAEWFQHRFVPDKPPGKLWTVTVGADRLLANFNLHRPAENEYVIDPTGLHPTEVI